MRILIDECVDERLRNSFSQHECQTVRYAGFAGLKNGDLLEAVESADFDVLVTVDRGWEHEQNLARRHVAVAIFCAKSNRLKDLLPHVPACLSLLRTIKPGEVAKVLLDPE